MPSITFLPLDEKTSSKYFSEIKQNVPYNLLFLSQNSYFFYSVLQKHISNHANVSVIDFSDELQVIAGRLRNEYIDYIGELSSQCNQKTWWLTLISERSPFTSNILLYICYTKIALHHIETQTVELICICESDALRTAIINNISPAKKTILKVVQMPFIQKVLTKYRKSPNFVNNLMTLYYLFWRILFSRVIRMKLRQKHNQSDKKKVIIFSWLDNRNFPGSGSFQDTYFGELAAELNKIGFEPHYIFYPIFCSYRTFLRKMLQIPLSFYLWEEFITLRDIGVALCKTRNISFPKIKITKFQNMFVSDIITEELENTKKDVSRRLRYLFFMIGKQKLEKIRSSSIIYSFENQSWEKMFIMGVHSSFPDIRFIGYTPSTVRKMHTFYSISQFEVNCPRPDVILVNGNKAKEELIQSGFNADTIIAAGAFRYKRTTPKVDQGEKKQFFTLLLATSISQSMSIEVISKIIEAFKNPDVHVIIKPHPALSPEYIASLIPHGLEHIVIKQDPIEDLLVESDIVVYSDTTVCIEALRLHIPVLHVKSSFSIDMNPLEGIDYVPSVSTPADIQKTTLQLLAHNPLQTETVDALVESFFKPVDGNTSYILEKYIT